MAAITSVPFFALIAQLGRAPDAPLRLFLRTTAQTFRPPNPLPHAGRVGHRQAAVLASGRAGPHQCASILAEERPGTVPTIILGGFVPDATEAAYLVRGQLLRAGSVFYVNYPRRGFSTELLFAQLEDLIEEIIHTRGRPPVLLGVSFGGGLALELLRRTCAAGREVPLAGLVLVSPVACIADLLTPGTAKPTTLLGRVILPYLEAVGAVSSQVIEKSRMLFLKMFEAGAQNKEAVRLLLTANEFRGLRDRVLAAITAIDPAGAVERVQALRAFPSPGAPIVLSPAPVLVLYAEKESAVLTETSPTTREFRSRLAAWFPRGQCFTVVNTPDNPVQHASLIFHCRNFLPYLAGFYRSLRPATHSQAA
jgi:pimeloyl-ACP methyl ester carboxylesterase